MSRIARPVDQYTPTNLVTEAQDSRRASGFKTSNFFTKPMTLVTRPATFSSLELTLNLLTTTIVAPPSNASKWQMGFNSAFEGMHEKPTNTPIIYSVY